MPEFSRKNDPEFFQVWLNDALQNIGSATMGEKNLPRPKSAECEVTNLILPDGRAGRAFSMSFPLHMEEERLPSTLSPRMATIVVAADIDELNHRMSRLAMLLLAVCGVATGVSLLATWVIVNRSLARQVKSRRKFQRVGLADLKEAHCGRIVAAGTGADRRAAERNARAAGCGVHARKSVHWKCRTRIANPARGREGGAGSVPPISRASPPISPRARRMPGAVDLMHRMVESLLSITRLGSGQITPRIERVQLTPLLHERWEEIAPPEKVIDVEWSTDDQIEVQADRTLLRSVVSNLLDNAASYVNDGGSVCISTRFDHDHAELRIANTGSTIAPEDVGKVFEPFWRVDPSRTATGRHCGLVSRSHADTSNAWAERSRFARARAANSSPSCASRNANCTS